MLLNADHQRNRPAKRYDAATNRVESIPTFAMGVRDDGKPDRRHVEKLYGRMIRSGLAAGTVHHAHRTCVPP